MGKKRDRKSASKKTKGELALESDIFGTSAASEVPNMGKIAAMEEEGDDVDRQVQKAVWEDDDDDELEVMLDDTARLRKLKKSGEDGKVTGAEFSARLKARLSSSRNLAWASQFDDIYGGSKKDKILQSSASLADRSTRGKALGPGKVDIARLVDANVSGSSNEPLDVTSFHASGSLLLTGGRDKYLRFFQVDGETNEMQLAVRIADMPVSTAGFLGQSSEVVVGGRRPYFYTYDTATGETGKIAGLKTRRNLASHELMALSPLGSRIAFVGAGGYVHVLDGKQKTWTADVKMNSGCRCAAFANEDLLLTSGLDADMYLWDLRMSGRCLSRFAHEDGTASSAMAISVGAEGGTFRAAVGTESGVASVFKMDPSSAQSSIFTHEKTFMNLTTKITSMSFNPTGEVLAFASDQKQDQLRLCHMASMSAFTNWPTDRTPLRRVRSVAFSPTSRYLTLGTNRGAALLYQLNHFSPTGHKKTRIRR